MLNIVSTHLDAYTYVARLRYKALRAGIRLEQVYDFHRIEDEANSINGRTPVTPAFSRENIDLSPATAFWICGYNDRGSLVHTQAVRLDDIRNMTLEGYWRQQIHRLWVTPAPDKGRLGPNLAMAAQHITGRVAYHGELWISPEYRNMEIAPMLCRLGMCHTYLQFDPDFMYGFVVKENVLRGFASRTGYPHQEADALNWEKAPHDYQHEWLVWASRNDLANLVNKPDAAFG